MNAPLNRRGACPTLRAPMQTGDGLLARLYPVDGGLTPAQLIGLAKAAARHGNGLLEITQRGSLQVRGLTEATTVLFAAEVDGLGIRVRDGVPVETGPLAGLDPEEIADPRPLAEAIRGGIAKAGLAGRLGPKVAVVVDGGGSSRLEGLKADVRVEAWRDDGGVRWCVEVPSAERVVQSEPLDQPLALTTALAVLGTIAELGNQARATDLTLAGTASILATPRPAIQQPPPSFPSRREIGQSSCDRRSLGYVSSTADLTPRGELPISPLEGEMAGRTEGGAGVKELSDGRFAAFCALPFGSVEADTLAVYVEAAAKAGATELRLAPNRTLIAFCPSRESATKATDVAGATGFIVDPADPRSRIVACSGSPACASGHIPARALAASIAAQMLADGAFELHISGCAKRCAAPSHRGLTLLGSGDGVSLIFDGGGTPDASPLAHVAKERVEAAFGRVAGLVSAERRQGETGIDTLRRIGQQRLSAAFAEGT
ncbi:MAG: precorrin-3B synthase [Rhizobiaceae bacterium]|nr:precorrin-3B synthase [Rhizobiaceae bacterium]